MGAAVALVRLDLDVRSEGGMVALRPCYVATFLGSWTAEGRAFVAEMFGHESPDSAQAATRETSPSNTRPPSVS
jgi:hypothetical protein